MAPAVPHPIAVALEMVAQVANPRHRKGMAYDPRLLEFAAQRALMSTVDVKAAYMASETDADDPWRRALEAELEARGIDV